MSEKKKDPAMILREAIHICGDCPECGSDNWTDDDGHGICESCGARFSPTIPNQMRLASNALSALLVRQDLLKALLRRARPHVDAPLGTLAADIDLALNR